VNVNVRKVIHDDIENSRFYIIIDEAKDEEKKMIIILWFVDKYRFIREPFVHVVNMNNTTIMILKQEVCNVLSRYDLFEEYIWGQ